MNWTRLRKECSIRSLPPVRFFLFGMGDRRKLIYQNGELKDARTGQSLHRWELARDWILPHEYSVVIETREGRANLHRRGRSGRLAS